MWDLTYPNSKSRDNVTAQTHCLADIVLFARERFSHPYNECFVLLPNRHGNRHGISQINKNNPKVKSEVTQKRRCHKKCPPNPPCPNPDLVQLLQHSMY